MEFTVVIPVNIYIDITVNLRDIPGRAQFMIQESFETLLESTKFPKCLGMMDTCSDVFFIDIFLTIFTHYSVLSTEL